MPEIFAFLIVLPSIHHRIGRVKKHDFKQTTWPQMGSKEGSSCKQKGCVQKEAFLSRNGSFSESVWKPCSTLKWFNPSQACLMVYTNQWTSWGYGRSYNLSPIHFEWGKLQKAACLMQVPEIYPLNAKCQNKCLGKCPNSFFSVLY